MVKGKFSLGPSSQLKLKTGWLEMKIIVALFTVLAVAAVMLTLLYLPLQGLASLDLARRHSHCNSELQSLQLEHEKQGHTRQMFASMDVHGLKSSSEGKPEDPVKQQPQILREWETPAVVDDHEWEKLDDKSYGVPRRFIPMGSGSFLFVQFAAYRGSSNSFAVVGLGPKPLHEHGNPGFECYWESSGSSTKVLGNATKYLPDCGYGKQYTVVIVHCTFNSAVGTDGTGGQLTVVATHGGWDLTGLEDVRFAALTERPGEYDGSVFEAPSKYDYLYCGSPLFGTISPQRMREWISYHMMLFGPRSHFILYDAGGIHADVRKILEPWMKLGRVTVMNIRQQMRYDTYYYNQFLVINDCLLRSKSLQLANWTFFFDVDEFVHVPWYLTFDYVMTDLYKLGRRATQVSFAQRPMSHNACLSNITSSTEQNTSSLWAMEKLTYRRTGITEPRGYFDQKFAIQAKYALATGVHRSGHVEYPQEGMELNDVTTYENWRLHYYHYHKSINNRNEEVCEKLIDPSVNATHLDNVAHEFDSTMVSMASSAREYELETVGPQPTIL